MLMRFNVFKELFLGMVRFGGQDIDKDEAIFGIDQIFNSFF